MHTQQVKIIGVNGQVSLGKEFAGKMVLIEQVEKGTWIIKCGEFIPDSEKWLYQNNNAAKIDQALAQMEKSDPTDNFDKFIKDMENGENKN